MITKSRVLDYIIEYKTGHDGLSPSYRQIMAACNLSSTSVVGYNLARLRDDGRIKINGTRGIAVVGGRWALTV